MGGLWLSGSLRAKQIACQLLTSPGSVTFREVPLTALTIIIAGPGVSREIYCELGEHKMGQNWKV